MQNFTPAMNNTLPIAGLHDDAANHFQEIYAALKQNFAMQPTGYIDFQLTQFAAFKECHTCEVLASYAIRTDNDNCYILFLQTTDHAQHGRDKIVEERRYEVWALAYLKHDMGRVKIRPETFTDKLVELVYPIEIDFKDDKPFSDVFYVIADEPAKAYEGMDRDFRNAVMDVRADDFVIEINAHTLVIGSKKPLNTGRALHMAEFVTRVTETCG
jgi:hypothetical protein